MFQAGFIWFANVSAVRNTREAELEIDIKDFEESERKFFKKVMTTVARLPF